MHQENKLLVSEPRRGPSLFSLNSGAIKHQSSPPANPHRSIAHESRELEPLPRSPSSGASGKAEITSKTAPHQRNRNSAPWITIRARAIRLPWSLTSPTLLTMSSTRRPRPQWSVWEVVSFSRPFETPCRNATSAPWESLLAVLPLLEFAVWTKYLNLAAQLRAWCQLSTKI